MATDLKALMKRFVNMVLCQSQSILLIVLNTSNLCSHLCVRYNMEVYSQLKAAMEKAKQSTATSQGNEIQSKQQPKRDSFVKTILYSWGSSK